ncbi:MAG: VCBS repeat-containing protein [Acidobacteria bacterium]|nr:VCBS repeat-containing protein [Acidobacteriota bacterium]MBI3423234.1 VCBS repeat-containing protein [Acidobacteriota bacterium]
MKYPANRSYVLWLCLLLTLGALTIQARYGVPLRWVQQPAPPVPASAPVAQPTHPARSAKPVLAAAPVQSGGTYNITPSVIAGGGARSSGGSNVAEGTLGQGLTGQSSGGTYALEGGFWPGAGVQGQAPTFIPAAALSRQQGSPAGAAVTVGTVSDQQVPAGNLTVTQIAGGTATGINVTNIVNTNGTITAQISAACGATAGTIRFQVSNGSLTGTGDLPINVTANTPPTLTYANASVNTGGVTTVNPATGPSDNGTLNSIALQSQGTYTGTISVNNATGVVSISNAAPVGTHTITTRATDNCGALTDTSFMLTINAGCPAITVNPVTLSSGTAGVVYQQMLTQTGGVGQINWSISAGNLPPGWSLNAATGQLGGLAVIIGVYNFTARATDTNSCQGTRTYTVQIKPKAKADFDGDGKTDLSIFSPTAAPPFPNWSVINSGNNATVTQQWGAGYAPYFDDIVPGDYDGDGKADHAIWRGADSLWYIRRSSDGQPFVQLWGANYAPYFDIPTPGDYDGDGKTDIGVFRRSGTWFVRRSSDGQNMIVTHGQQDDIPVPADYDGDGKTDLAIFRPGAIAPAPNWIILNSSTNTITSIQWGAGYAPYFDTPVPADYDGDGKADLAIWRGADSIWYIRKSSDGQAILQFWGANYAPYFDIPTPGDYDGDGKADIAVWRRSGTWFVKRSTDGSFLIQNQGQSGDVPVPAFGVR